MSCLRVECHEPLGLGSPAKEREGMLSSLEVRLSATNRHVMLNEVKHLAEINEILPCGQNDNDSNNNP